MLHKHRSKFFERGRGDRCHTEFAPASVTPNWNRGGNRGPLHLALLCSVCAAALTFLHLLCLASSEADGRLVGHWGQGHGHPNLLHYWEDVLLIGQLLNSNLLRQRKTMQCMIKAEKKTYPQQWDSKVKLTHQFMFWSFLGMCWTSSPVFSWYGFCTIHIQIRTAELIVQNLLTLFYWEEETLDYRNYGMVSKFKLVQENEKEVQNPFQIWETFPCWSFNPPRYWGWPLTPPLWIEIYGDSAGLTAWPPLTSADTLNNYPVLLMMRDGLSVLPVYLPNRWPGPHSGRLLDGWLAGQMVG